MIDFSELDQYFNRVNFSNHYQWHDEVTGVHNIPRVTEIIDRCMDSTALMNWAHTIGVNGIIYKDFRKKILETGTKSHKAIEDYIKTGKIDPDAPVNPIHAFENWWKGLHATYSSIKILGQEFTLKTPYFGGTYDMLLDLDGEVNLIDFKTSKSIHYNYFIQLAAYKYMLEFQGICNVDKIIIVRIPKDKPNYETMCLDMKNPTHASFINECLHDFANMVQVFWSDTLVENQFNQIRKDIKGSFFKANN